MSSYPFPAAGPAQQSMPSADPTAVIGRRIGAWVIDFLLYALIMAFVGPTPLSPLAEYYDTSDAPGVDCELIQEANDVSSCVQIGDRLYFTEGSDAAISFVVFLAVFLLYSLLQGSTGRTPGKAAFGVKVVDEQGGTPGFGKSILRTVLWIVDGAPWCAPLVGFITGLSTKGHRRVGDMAAKTFVVGKDHTGPPQVPGLVTAASGGWPGGPGGYGQPGQPGQPWGAAPAPQAPTGPPTATAATVALNPRLRASLSRPRRHPAPLASPDPSPNPTSPASVNRIPVAFSYPARILGVTGRPCSPRSTFDKCPCDIPASRATRRNGTRTLSRRVSRIRS